MRDFTIADNFPRSVVQQVIERQGQYSNGWIVRYYHAISKLFAREGSKEVVADVNVVGGEEAVKSIVENGGDAIFVKAHVTKALAIQGTLYGRQIRANYIALGDRDPQKSSSVDYSKCKGTWGTQTY